MKKISKILSLFLAVVMLGGCGERPSKETPYVSPWSADELTIFNEHLYGFELPYEDDISVNWDGTKNCVVLEDESRTLNEFNNYINSIVDLGFSKKDGPSENSYVLIKEVEYEGKDRVIDIDAALYEDAMTLYCYDPFIYEWPEAQIEDLFTTYFYRAPSLKVPSIIADRYFCSDVEDSTLNILCYSKTSLYQQYKTILENSGFTVNDSVATEPTETVYINFSYLTDDQCLMISISPRIAWPAQAVDYYTDQLTGGSGTRVPAVTGANEYELIDSIFETYGYLSVLCATDKDLEPSYEEALANDYTIYNSEVNSAGNYFAISRQNDLLIQYKYYVKESPFGGDDYKEFSVFFEKYYPYNEDHVNQALQIIAPGSTTVLPEYPGYGQKISISDNDIYMEITIQSSFIDSLATYVNTLDKADWDVKEFNNFSHYCDAISPNRDLELTTSFVNGRFILKYQAYHDEYSEWPIDKINEMLTDLRLTGEVPVFDNAYGYDYYDEKGYHEIVCFVKTGKEEDRIVEYYNKLYELGWTYLTDGTNFFFLNEDTQMIIHAYFDSYNPGTVFISIEHYYDIDASAAFELWKEEFFLDSQVTLCGFNLTADPSYVDVSVDDGNIYTNYALFRLLLGITEAEMNDSINEVINQLVADGWTYSATDEKYHKQDMWLVVYRQNDDLIIDICCPLPREDVLSQMISFVSKLSFGSSITLPESIDITDEYELAIESFNTGNYIDMTLRLTFGSSTKASNAVNEIIGAFAFIGWEIDSYYTSSTTAYMVDPSYHLDLQVYQAKNSNQILVQFSEHYNY